MNCINLTAEARQVALVMASEEQVLVVQGDFDLLTQVFCNLLDILLMWMVLLTGFTLKGGEAMQDNAYEVLGPMTAGLTVNNLDNEAVSVDALWEDRRVVLVFLRHYG